MSLWYENLGLCLNDCGEDIRERARCILAHLSMDVPRSWWEHALQTGSVPKVYTNILHDLHEELSKTYKSAESIGFGLLVAMAFTDDNTDQQLPRFGTVYSKCFVEQYLAKAKEILAKRPELNRLGQAIEKRKTFLNQTHSERDKVKSEADKLTEMFERGDFDDSIEKELACEIRLTLSAEDRKFFDKEEGLTEDDIDFFKKLREGKKMSFDTSGMDNSSKSIEKLLSSIESSKGRSTGWPSCFNYNFDFNNSSCVITLEDKHSKQNFRKFDPWALAFLAEFEGAKLGVKQIVFEIKNSEKERDKSFAFNVEAFKRRVSFLALNNQGIKFEIRIEDDILQLYDSIKTLFDRPKEEKIHKRLGKHSDDDAPGRLEKDFQAWLFGKGLNNTESDERTNERLAVLGDDFFNLKGKGLKIYREFPTGVFKEKIEKTSRILPTDYIDIVTFNKHNNLSVIELKLNDSKLDVISQILDYALFFRCYRDQLLPVLEKHFSLKKIRNDKIICYVANNYFHPRLDKIRRFYSTKEKGYGFELKQITLGHTKLM